VNIIECHFEFGGFDDHLVKAGVSVYLWNLCRQFRAAGHQVTGLTAAHGLLPWLRDRYPVTDLDWHASEAIPVRLDPEGWPGFPEQVVIPADVTAHHVSIDGVDVVLLAGGMLDEHTDTFYPPHELEGRDLSFLKPLVFQVMAARFLADMAPGGTIVHLHEPCYHYLVPAAVQRYGLVTISTVQTNLPANTKVYGPEVRTLLRHLGADPSVTDGLADPPLNSPLEEAMRCYLPSTWLYREYPERPGHDYISMLGMVVRSVHALDFLSAGQLDHAMTQAGTPFEQLFERLPVRRELRSRSHSLVVGGCAIGDEWLDLARSDECRKQTLNGLGLDEMLPTVYHNARYSPQHKGQQDMFRALRRLLDDGERCNVLLHCLAPHPPRDPDLDALARGYPHLVRVRTDAMTQPELAAWAGASDLCLFPSKFEMDTFLIAMGEAMASGAVPIATAQQGMRHFAHAFSLDDPTATGLALPRSFRVGDPALTEAITVGLRHMLQLVRSRPDQIEILRTRATALARTFTWEKAASRFLAIFSACASGSCPVPDCARLAGHVTPADWDRGSSAGLSAALRGAAQARRVGDAICVRLDWAAAAGADAVVPSRPAQVTSLHQGLDGWFRGRVPAPGIDHVALLVTFPDGQTAWTDVTVSDGGGIADA
jgi:glycosyltransferase involved in cell wall biosynthesis